MTLTEIAALPVGSRLHNPYLTGADWVRFEDGWHLIEQADGFDAGEPAGHDWSHVGQPAFDLDNEAPNLVLIT